MTIEHSRRRRRAGLAVTGWALAALLAGCAANRPAETPAGGAAATAVEAVRARAEARWQALIQHDFARAYTYLSPGRRSAITVEQYINLPRDSRLTWTAADWLGAECEAGRCVARLQISSEYLHPNPGAGQVPIGAPVEEVWLAIDGIWYYTGE